MDVEYCFVFGCPRSGTSALARLLHHHNRIVMGVERFKYLLKTKERRASFGPDLFEADRFLDFRDGDTNVLPTSNAGKHVKHYATAERRFRDGTVLCVGDKVRAHESVIWTIETKFPSPKFVFIYRDLLDVANSFEKRAKNPEDESWSADHGYVFALTRWNMAFAAAESFMGESDARRIFLVKYERLFNGELRTCDALFRFLGLSVTPAVRRHFETATSRWDERQASHLELLPDQREFLLQRLDRPVLDRFDSLFEAQFTAHT